MAVNLRNSKGSALTYTELDNNFSDFMTLGSHVTNVGRAILSINAPDFVSTSDLRLKENLQPVSNSESLYKINAYTFNFKSDQSKKRKYGLIAQDLAQYFPETVTMGEDGYLRVSYDSLVPVVIELLKAQKKEIDNLKSEITDLKRLMEK